MWPHCFSQIADSKTEPSGATLVDIEQVDTFMPATFCYRSLSNKLMPANLGRNQSILFTCLYNPWVLKTTQHPHKKCMERKEVHVSVFVPYHSSDCDWTSGRCCACSAKLSGGSFYHILKPCFKWRYKEKGWSYYRFEATLLRGMKCFSYLVLYKSFDAAKHFYWEI